jgi:hypothetical protein
MAALLCPSPSTADEPSGYRRIMSHQVRIEHAGDKSKLARPVLRFGETDLFPEDEPRITGSARCVIMAI